MYTSADPFHEVKRKRDKKREVNNFFTQFVIVCSFFASLTLSYNPLGHSFSLNAECQSSTIYIYYLYFLVVSAFVVHLNLVRIP